LTIPEITPAQQEEQSRQEELRQIVLLISANNIEGLIQLLSKASSENRLAASIYLANLGDKRALEILDKLSTQITTNEPNNIFAVTNAVLKKKLEAQEVRTEKPAEEKKIEKHEAVTAGVLSGHVKDAETEKGLVI
jgi:hypothetical protein